MKRKRSRSEAKRPGNFDAALQQRAAGFLAQLIPVELQPEYIADSLADRLIAACARNEDLHPELLELAALVCREYDDVIAGARTEELKTYYTTSRDLLAEIIAASR